MLGTDIRGIMAEEEEVQRRQEALQSLMSMREKLLRESLEARIKRARGTGDWTNLSPAECASIYKEERVHLRAQLERLKAERDGKPVFHETWAMDAWGDVRGTAMGRLVSVPVSLAVEAVQIMEHCKVNQILVVDAARRLDGELGGDPAAERGEPQADEERQQQHDAGRDQHRAWADQSARHCALWSDALWRVRAFECVEGIVGEVAADLDQ